MSDGVGHLDACELCSLAALVTQVFVTFGLFNLIFAIYIETTLSAAKLNRRMSKAEHLRVARLTKEWAAHLRLGITRFEYWCSVACALEIATALHVAVGAAEEVLSCAQHQRGPRH
eukprot:5488546-Amphidinium_carterae.1